MKVQHYVAVMVGLLVLLKDPGHAMNVASANRPRTRSARRSGYVAGIASR